MEKQTAVDWLIEKWSTQGTLYSSDIFQAKEMEKEQFINLHIETMKEGLKFENGQDWDEKYFPKIKSMAEKTWNKEFKSE